MSRVWRSLRSPRLALGVLAFLALYCSGAAWFPWQRAGALPPPSWAARLHLDHPFSSPVFLAATVLLFLSTAVCTWDRTLRVAGLARGQVRPSGTPFPAAARESFEDFCRSEGFGGRGPVLFRARFAIWGGWVFHVGLLSLMAGILIQQGFHDGGAFQVAEGESVRLDTPGAVFGREKGVLAAALPPALTVGLAAFDPFLHQPGYAPDRACVLRVESPGQPAREGRVDRAAGFGAGLVTIYQALPSGLCLNLEIEGIGVRSLHLRDETHQRLTGDFTAPGGRPFRFTLESERHFDDAVGTGLLRIRAEGPAGTLEVVPGSSFSFGTASARLVSVGRWGGFTYSRSPGMPAVFAGFAFLLLGSALMSFPAGVALLGRPGEEAAGWIWVNRGREALLAEWNRSSQEAASDGGT